MIDINKMQIGDYVYTNLPFGSDKIVRLDIYDFYKISMNKHIQNEFNYIRLNDGFLTSLGFIYQANAFCGSNRYYLELFNDEFGHNNLSIWEYHLEEYFYGDVGFKYVHELQHFFKLKGVELNLTFKDKN